MPLRFGASLFLEHARQTAKIAYAKNPHDARAKNLIFSPPCFVPLLRFFTPSFEINKPYFWLFVLLSFLIFAESKDMGSIASGARHLLPAH